MKKPKEPKEPKEKKPKKPKKEKAPKEKKPKKPKKGEAPEEGQEGKKKKKPILLIIPLAVVLVVAAVVIFVILPGRNADDPDVEVSVEPVPPSLPPEYEVGDEKVAGMTLGADESEAKAVPAKTVVYTYVDLVDAGKAAETYVSQLAAADPRFYVVDEEFVRTDRPDFSTAEGTVLMARDIVVETPEPSPEPSPEAEESPEGGEATEQPTPSPAPTEPVEEVPTMVLTVKMEWSPGQCVVTADQAEGKVTSPPPSQTSGGGGMGQRAAQDYLKGLEPAQLGLEGSSMDDYEVMIIDGLVRVDAQPCTKLNVYDEDNVFVGCYLVALDGQHLYELDTLSGRVTELEMPK